MEISLTVVLSLYFLFNLGLIYFWLRLKKTPAIQLPVEGSVLFSVVIPVRNEAQNMHNLLQDLNAQTLPAARFEVIVANDNSTDDTRQIALNFATNQARFDLKVIDMPEDFTVAPKKRAIDQAIQMAQGEWILTTDGDCRVGADWLRVFAQNITPQVQLLSGPVTFVGFRSWAQTIEFSSLIGTGASAIGAGFPTMCNGANLAYRKRAFLQVAGFEGINTIASGDDELLLHKIAGKFPDGIRFVKSALAVVQTAPQPNWRSFYNQRKRWASKWDASKRWPTMLLAVFIFVANASIVLAFAIWLRGAASHAFLSKMLFLKCGSEFIFLALILRFLNKQKLIPLVVVVQFFYPFYVLFFGIVAQQKGFEWKGRQLK